MPIRAQRIARGGRVGRRPLLLLGAAAILAGAAAWKYGGGCISTILVFIIVFWLLGYVHC